MGNSQFPEKASNPPRLGYRMRSGNVSNGSVADGRPVSLQVRFVPIADVTFSTITTTPSELMTRCGKGWIQSADASTTKEMTPAAKL